MTATIQGNGTFVSAAQQEIDNPGQKAYFDKYIYNLKANSLEAAHRKENRQLLAAAIVAEGKGETEKADELYNQWLNACQISFNQIADRGRKLQDGDMVTAIIGLADTKAGHKAVVVNDVRYKAPVSVEKVKFDITDLFSDEDMPEEPKVEAPAPKAEAKKAVK